MDATTSYHSIDPSDGGPTQTSSSFSATVSGPPNHARRPDRPPVFEPEADSVNPRLVPSHGDDLIVLNVVGHDHERSRL